MCKVEISHFQLSFVNYQLYYVQENFIQFLEEVVLTSLCGTCGVVENFTVTLTQLRQCDYDMQKK